MSTPLRACRPRLTAAQGPRVEQRAILARTLQKSQSRAKASEHGRGYEQACRHPSKTNTPRELILKVRNRPRLCEYAFSHSLDPKRPVTNDRAFALR